MTYGKKRNSRVRTVQHRERQSRRAEQVVRSRWNRVHVWTIEQTGRCNGQRIPLAVLLEGRLTLRCDRVADRSIRVQLVMIASAFAPARAVVCFFKIGDGTFHDPLDDPDSRSDGSVKSVEVVTSDIIDPPRLDSRGNQR
jgi:hypothetical protein